MADATAGAVPYMIGALLIVGIWRQFVPVGQIGGLFDRLSIAPQWRFYAQRQVGADAAMFDDLHLIARKRRADGVAGPWQALFGPADRAPITALWHPRRRSDEYLTEMLQALCPAAGEVPGIVSVPYLATLRFCLAATGTVGEGHVQFAIVTTRGRASRDPAVVLLSPWHRR